MQGQAWTGNLQSRDAASECGSNTVEMDEYPYTDLRKEQAQLAASSWMT